MEITQEQRSVWRDNPETAEWEAVMGPCYKRSGEVADVEALLCIAETRRRSRPSATMAGREAASSGRDAMNVPGWNDTAVRPILPGGPSRDEE